MIIETDPNYSGPIKVKTSGHKKGQIFQPLGETGKIVVRSMPEHYNDANSAAQQPFRDRQKWIMHMWSKLKDQIKGCFEGPKSDYIQFLSHNLLQKDGRCMVSHGSLPSDADWKPGDILREIVSPDGQTAQVHLRPTDTGYSCSTEYLSQL